MAPIYHVVLARKLLSMRLGVFGGSFNPVHYGHLLLAEFCREACGLELIWFIPAATAPHKEKQKHTTDTQRLEMLQLATAGNVHFEVSDMEIERGGVSYTVDTLQQIRDQRPDDELFFLMGGDSLDDFHLWREPARICELATPLVVDRHGATDVDVRKFEPFVSDERLSEIRSHQVRFPVVEISSTDVRQRAGSARSLRYRLPRSVEKYIENAKLYRSNS